MPTPMSPEELTKALEGAKRLDEFEFGNIDSGNWFTAALHQNGKGVFRVVEASGFESKFNGAGNIGEWLMKDWTKF